MSIFANVLVKVLFFTCILLQVILWPSVMTVVFSSAVAIEGIITYFTSSKSEVSEGMMGSGIFVFQGKVSKKSYILNTFVGIYMTVLFMRFTVHETNLQPHMTTWIHGSRIRNYSFTDSLNNPFPDVEVTGDISKTMRENTFVWPKTWQDSAVRLNGTIPTAGPEKSDLRCFPDISTLSTSATNLTVPNNIRYACYASKLAIFKTPNAEMFGTYRFVPMPSQFYTTDVMVTPFPGSKCADLEVYRIVVDGETNIEHGLDYPASAATPTSNGKDTLNLDCGLFSDPKWCLHFQHTFSKQEYAAKIAAKCVEGGGSLIFRLPVRSSDVDPSTGRVGLDTLLVSTGANVQLRFLWHSQGETPPYFSTWEQWQTSTEDGTQTWRDSSESGSVFFKFALMITPLLIVWYFLAIQFETLIDNSQILVLCIFILLPSILIFLSVGAWLPMAGSIVCAIAINHSPPNVEGSSYWKTMIRPVLFFITAACNSIQFAWMMALVGQAGWSAFLYDSTLQQLSDLSSNFIISDSTSPSWIGLAMPSVLLVNIAFLMGSAVCIVLETIHPAWAKGMAPKY